ncbi:MAG: hypothetical protein M5U26_25770 [Planctomycetota bacterium]|nr:hypothetical protein [Planctomycetota bacterium]
MRIVGLSLLAVSLLGWTCHAGNAVDPVVKGADGKRAFDDLARYYADNKQVPGFEAALNDLKAPDAAKSKAAGTYLFALLKQMFEDESNGRAPWKKTPFFGSRPVCDARTFRKTVASSLGKHATGPNALPALEWLLMYEKDAGNQAAAIEALGRQRGAECAALFKSLLAQPHPNAKVAQAVVDLAAERGMKELAPEIQRLCGHYRAAVREAALKAAPKLGGAKLPEYRPEAAFTPWLEEQLANVRKMVPWELPAKATWMHFTPAAQPDAGGLGALVLEDTAAAFKALDWWGQQRELAKKDYKAEPRGLAAEAQALAALRKEAKNPRDLAVRLSRGGAATAQFEPPFASLPEVLVGAWCFEKGEKAAAAELLFPRLEAMADDRWMAWVARDLLGHPLYQQALVAFSHGRDYDAALKLFLHLSGPLFDEYTYQDESQKLAGELAQRGDEFKSFKLPTPQEWEAQKKKLGREEQIAFLGERLRLLNCIQLSQPGNVNYADEQSTRPFAERSRIQGGGAHLAINPFNELRAMALQPKDLPALVPFLADERCMPTFSYWRDFDYRRTVHQVNWVVASVLNEAAKKDLARLADYNGADEAGRKAHLDGILAWCRENAGKTRDQLPDELPKQQAGGPRIDAP